MFINLFFPLFFQPISINLHGCPLIYFFPFCKPSTISIHWIGSLNFSFCLKSHFGPVCPPLPKFLEIYSDQNRVRDMKRYTWEYHFGPFVSRDWIFRNFSTGIFIKWLKWRIKGAYPKHDHKIIFLLMENEALCDGKWLPNHFRVESYFRKAEVHLHFYFVSFTSYLLSIFCWSLFSFEFIWVQFLANNPISVLNVQHSPPVERGQTFGDTHFFALPLIQTLN